SVPVINPPRNTELAKTAPVVSVYRFPGPNLTPAETWSSGHRTPYGLAFAPDGRLWEMEHGPRGGDELNLIEPGKNYGGPLGSYWGNYKRGPLSPPYTRTDGREPESSNAARPDQADHLLDAGHRAGEPHVLQRQDVSPVAGFGAGRRDGD